VSRRRIIPSLLEEFPAHQVREEGSPVTLGLHRLRDDEA
jgi:hypothetical protein